MVLSKSSFLAPIFTATPKPCMTSSLPCPMMWTPTTLSSGPTQTSLYTEGSLCSSSIIEKYRERKEDLSTIERQCLGKWDMRKRKDIHILTASPYFLRASGSVKPTVPIVG